MVMQDKEILLPEAWQETFLGKNLVINAKEDQRSVSTLTDGTQGAPQKIRGALCFLEA